jgi:hypothetical protein
MFTWKLVEIAFDTDKRFGMVAIDQVGMERNETMGRCKLVASSEASMGLLSVASVYCLRLL